MYSKGPSAIIHSDREIILCKTFDLDDYMGFGEPSVKPHDEMS